MSFNIISTILRSEWLLNKQWATDHLPIVGGIIKGESFNFGEPLKATDNVTVLIASMGSTPRNVYGVRPYSNLNQLEFGSIAVVSLSGPMIKNGGACSYGMVDQAQLINRLAAANNIAGIIVDIDSPGGQADGTALLAGAIKEAGARKPVISHINDGMAASAAMWIASAANEIYASQPTDEFGSIGVYTTIADWAGYYESMGLKTKDIYAPQSTDKNKGYYDALGGDDSLIKEGLSVLADQFINTVATNRAGKIKGDSWKTGKMFFAADAKKIGLIDGIKSLGQVVDRINSLLSQKQKSTNSAMAFEKTLVAAKATEFAVTDDGFVLSEEQLNNVEAVVANGELAIAAQLESGAHIAALNEQIETLTSERDTANDELSVNSTRISELQSQVAALGAESSGKGTVITSKADEQNTDDKGVPSWMDDNNPANQFADKRIKKK
ncbi:MAG: S49 family peptidase [Bacteroidota bacterium]